MKKQIILTLVFAMTLLFAQAQTEKVYDENADAAADIKKAVEMAKQKNKHVLIVIGGNWCPWCLRLNKFINEDAEIKAALYDNYEVVKVNYDKEHTNMPVLSKLEFPQRLGFPVIVILDQDGQRIHTQNSAYLELEKSYDKKKLIGFFNDWTVTKLDASNYIK
ncbi:MAG: thioredoxin family protein [Bacteroidetes bacterium]|nr:thioredoxin family protein [Bacteroidota bacterium]